MPKIGDLSASIRVDGKDLEEYDVQVDEANRTATCWIASEAGKVRFILEFPFGIESSFALTQTYAVHWTDQQYQLPTSGYIDIDGHQCGGSVIERDNKATLPHDTFKDNDHALLSAPPAPDIGLIKLTIYQIRIISRDIKCQVKAPESRTFHEKTKKGIGHQTSFGRFVTTRETPFVEVGKIGPPVATFSFKYRPLGILQAQGIAPPPPATQRTSPSPPRPVPKRTTHKRYKMELDSDGEIMVHSDQDDEDGGRLKELQREMDAIRARQDGERPRKKIKREPIVGETIDLTLDD
ncbi:hypothetical protein PQX77_005331 [Marasmius sp. AFHP31]|nr:hypothetical protein PQX77_005331 [Marasmius sp. AFHP31]